MRVSSLSDARILALVSRYFVPVWLSRDHYQLRPPDRDEQALVARIDADRRRKRLPGGAVCVYVVRADGTVLDTLPVQKASKPELLAPFLRQIVVDQELSPRDPRTAPLLPGPKARQPGGLLLTIRTRFDDPGSNRGTSRDVVELTRPEWSAFLPPGKPFLGQRWTLPATLSGKLLVHAYPPLPHWKANLAKLDRGRIEGRVSALQGKRLDLRLEGNLDLIYPHLGKPTDGRVTARLVGLARVEGEKLETLLLTSEEGLYRWHWQDRPQKRPMSLAIELER